MKPIISGIILVSPSPYKHINTCHATHGVKQQVYNKRHTHSQLTNYPFDEIRRKKERKKGKPNKQKATVKNLRNQQELIKETLRKKNRKIQSSEMRN